MLEFFQKYDYLIIPYLMPILRVFLIPFTSLGIVSILGRLLEWTNTDRSRNRAAVISMIFISFLTGIGAGEPSVMFTFAYSLNAFFNLCISSIIYIALCWRFYPRLDALLDKKVACDDKNKNIDDDKRKAQAILRKVNKEKKLVEEEKKRLNKKEKRLTKKE